MDTVIVDTLDKCKDAVANLFQEQDVAIDIQGIKLSRDGEMCWIQMCGTSSPVVYLFDIYTLKESAFGEGGLRELLESEKVTKMFFDVRGANDALYHLHRVQVHGAYDIQIMWHVRFPNSANIYLEAFQQALVAYLHETKILFDAQMEAMERLKKQGLQLIVPEHGGSYEVWKQRPMPPELIQYAAVDVKYLSGMKELCTPKDNDLAQQLNVVVKELSAARLQAFVELPDDQAREQIMNRYRDFQIPPGFNDGGDVSQMVYVPSHAKSLLIGTGGATLKDLRASSGARINLIGRWRVSERRWSASVLVVGQPAQVHSAVQQIYLRIGYTYTAAIA